jgi:hypothetical protein
MEFRLGEGSRRFFFGGVMQMMLKTREAVKVLGTTYWTIISLIRSNRVPAPEKDISGDYIWTPKDLQLARNALENRKKGKKTIA